LHAVPAVEYAGDLSVGASCGCGHDPHDGLTHDHTPLSQLQGESQASRHFADGLVHVFPLTAGSGQQLLAHV
jgi:hypothetical protein